MAELDETFFQRIDSMTDCELDALPFGIIELDEQGIVRHYNTYESQLASLPRESVLGRNFFKEIAPCTDVQDFFGRFREGVQLRELNAKFRYHFAFEKRPRDVLVTLYYSAATGGVWVLVQPID